MHDIEMKYYGDAGFLYPFDVRYNPGDRAFCDLLPDGRVRFRVWTQPVFKEAMLVFNDGKPQATSMTRTGDDTRFTYWETVVRFAATQITYSFAFLTYQGRPVYHCAHGIDHSVEILDRYRLDLGAMLPFETPDWAKGAVIYQIFPERFANGDRGNDPTGLGPGGSVPWGSPPAWMEFQGGDLQGITQKLDYLQDLGIDILYLTPIFTSPSTHKYDCSDFYHVDPGFGGDDALRELVDGLHRRGMKIVLDASFNHCHPRFFAFQDLVHNGPASRYKEWFTVREWPVRVKYRPHLAERTLASQATAGGRAAYLRFLETFPQVTGVQLEEVTEDGPLVEATYLAWYGVLDMPKINLSNPETRSYFLDVTRYWLREFKIDGWRMDVARHIVPDFWDDFRRAAKETNPDCYLLAEIWGNTSPWLQGNRFDATMNYFFRDLVADYFATEKMDTQTFIDGIDQMLALYAPQVTLCNHNLFSSHDVTRLLHEADEDLVRLRLATLFQMTLPGAPGVYYGDEIGMTGGDDPDNRRAFPWDQPETWDRETLDLTRTLIRLRREHLALRLGEWKPVWQGDNAFAFERRFEDERVLVVINRGDAIDRVNLPAAAQRAEVLWGQAQVAKDEATVAVMGVGARTGVMVRVS